MHCRRCKSEVPSYVTTMDNRAVECCGWCGQRLHEGAYDKAQPPLYVPYQCYEGGGKAVRDDDADPARRPAYGNRIGGDAWV